MVNSKTTTPEPAAFVIFGIPFHDVTFAEAVAWAVARMKSGRPACIATANLDFVMQAWRDPELHRILLEADLVIADGWPMVWASKMFGPALRERVTGSDITPMLATACTREGLGIFLLGGAPGVAEKAAEKLCHRNPGLRIAGCHSPPVASVLEMDHAAMLQRLETSAPHLLLVAFGAPKQEKFINLNLRRWNVPLAIGIGGTLDFLAGVQQRAPVWVQRIRLEWLWRLGTNPQRLFRRYAGNIGFLWTALRQLRALHAAGKALETQPTELVLPNAAPGQDVTVDLAGRGALDSRELGRLVTLARQLRATGHRLGLINATPVLAAFLRTCRLDGYLELEGTSATPRTRPRCGSASLFTDALLITLPEELTAGSVDDWSLRVNTLGLEKVRRVEIDAAGVDYLDSSGVGWLVRFRKECELRRIVFSCSGFAGRPLQTLQLVRLDTAFTSSE